MYMPGGNTIDLTRLGNTFSFAGWASERRFELYAVVSIHVPCQAARRGTYMTAQNAEERRGVVEGLEMP